MLAIAKKCSTCGERYPLSEFYRRSDTSDGLCLTCKKCDKERRQRARERDNSSVCRRESKSAVFVGEKGPVYLAAAVVARACHEWKSGGNKAELRRFFRSDDFEFFCDAGNVNPDVVRERLGIR